MAVTLLAHSQVPLTARHHREVSSCLVGVSQSSLGVESIAESCLRIICPDIDTALSLVDTIHSVLVSDREDIKVELETFDVLVCGMDGLGLSLDEVAESNPLTIERSHLADFEIKEDASVVLKFLRQSFADSAIIRGLHSNGCFFRCRPIDPHDRGAYWCYRCLSIFCLTSGGVCDRKDPTCRYCTSTSHISRTCPERGNPAFIPTCKSCQMVRGIIKHDHASWDAIQCRNSWHKRPTHLGINLQRKRKLRVETGPRKLRHRSQSLSSNSEKELLSSIPSPDIASSTSVEASTATDLSTGTSSTDYGSLFDIELTSAEWDALAGEMLSSETDQGSVVDTTIPDSRFPSHIPLLSTPPNTTSFATQPSAPSSMATITQSPGWNISPTPSRSNLLHPTTPDFTSAFEDDVLPDPAYFDAWYSVFGSSFVTAAPTFPSVTSTATDVTTSTPDHPAALYTSDTSHSDEAI